MATAALARRRAHVVSPESRRAATFQGIALGLFYSALILFAMFGPHFLEPVLCQ